MQPPKVNSKLDADELARDAQAAGVAGNQRTDGDRDDAVPASEGDAAIQGAKDIADAQEQVVERGLTRLPPG